MCTGAFKWLFGIMTLLMCVKPTGKLLYVTSGTGKVQSIGDLSNLLASYLKNVTNYVSVGGEGGGVVCTGAFKWLLSIMTLPGKLHV